VAPSTLKKAALIGRPASLPLRFLVAVDVPLALLLLLVVVLVPVPLLLLLDLMTPRVCCCEA
jgi:hypothetical protein